MTTSSTTFASCDDGLSAVSVSSIVPSLKAVSAAVRRGWRAFA